MTNDYYLEKVKGTIYKQLPFPMKSKFTREDLPNITLDHCKFKREPVGFDNFYKVVSVKISYNNIVEKWMIRDIRND